METKYYIYIIKCEKWTRSIFKRIIYYTGLTTNPKRRLYEHKHGIKSAWMRLNNINPLFFIYIEEYNDLSKAKIREKEIKKMSVKNKIKLSKQ